MPVYRLGKYFPEESYSFQYTMKAATFLPTHKQTVKAKCSPQNHINRETVDISADPQHPNEQYENKMQRTFFYTLRGSVWLKNSEGNYHRPFDFFFTSIMGCKEKGVKLHREP